MATIRRITNKGGVRWRAQVWVGGERASARFDTKAEAQSWALRREAEIATDGRLIHGQTFGEAMARYAREVSPKKRGERAEVIRLTRIRRDPIAAKLVTALTLDDAEEYRDRRLAQIQTSSVSREMTVLKAVLRRCVRWRWLESYPWVDFENPDRGRARTRIYTDEEIGRLFAAAKLGPDDPVVTRAQQTVIALGLSVETAMRQSEMTSLDWSDIDIERRVIQLSLTKNGDDRRVPLSRAALAYIDRIPKHFTSPFPMSPASMSQNFMRVRKLAGLDGVVFHDARRTACTRLAKKLPPMDLAKVTGHRDLRTLLRVYYQADAEALALMLD